MNNKIRYRMVHNRTGRLRADGTALIQIEARIGTRKMYFSSSIYVKPEQWSGIICNHSNAEGLNAMLTDMIVKLETVEIDLWKHNIIPTLQHLKKGWKSEGELTEFAVFAKDVIEHSARKKNTKDNIINTVNKVESLRPHINVTDIDYAFLTEFENSLRQEGLELSTIAKQMDNIRTILSEAKRRGLATKDPFTVYQKPKAVAKEHVTLTEREMKRIAKVDEHANVRDAFLFCCNTGLRFSDYKRLTNDNFIMIGSKMWLYLGTQKTGVEIRIPMSLLGIEDLPRPMIGSNSDVNGKLKEILKIAKVTDKRVTFHTSRHTFATRMLNKGVPITTVQAMLGHTTVRMTQRYAETKMERVAKDVARAMKAG